MRPFRFVAGVALLLVAAAILFLVFVHGWAPPPTNGGQPARCYDDLLRAKLPMSIGCVMAAHETLAAGLIAAAAALGAAWLAFSGLQRQIKIAKEHTTLLQRQIEMEQSNAKILQRAYISIEPHGIKPWHQSGVPVNVVGHVQCRNVGHLPARNFQLSRIKMRWVDASRIEDEIPGDVEVERFKQTIPIQASVTAGSNALSPEDLQRVKAREGYLLVWGKATYRDGFDSTPDRILPSLPVCRLQR